MANASDPKVIPLTPMAPLTAERAVSTRAVTAGAWWARWLMLRQLKSTQSELNALDGLTAETLKDIGAPEWMLERARRAKENSRQGGLLEREFLHWR